MKKLQNQELHTIQGGTLSSFIFMSSATMFGKIGATIACEILEEEGYIKDLKAVLTNKVDESTEKNKFCEMGREVKVRGKSAYQWGCDKASATGDYFSNLYTHYAG